MNTPYFLWDYNLNDTKIRAILHGSNQTEKKWLIARILTHARFEDVWNYLTIKDIVHTFPKLRLPQNVKKNWQRALNTWGYHA